MLYFNHNGETMFLYSEAHEPSHRVLYRVYHCHTLMIHYTDTSVCVTYLTVLRQKLSPIERIGPIETLRLWDGGIIYNDVLAMKWTTLGWCVPNASLWAVADLWQAACSSIRINDDTIPCVHMLLNAFVDRKLSADKIEICKMRKRAPVVTGCVNLWPILRV